MPGGRNWVASVGASHRPFCKADDLAEFDHRALKDKGARRLQQLLVAIMQVNGEVD